jgi:hypothetical protein
MSKPRPRSHPTKRMSAIKPSPEKSIGNFLVHTPPARRRRRTVVLESIAVHRLTLSGVAIYESPSADTSRPFCSNSHFEIRNMNDADEIIREHTEGIRGGRKEKSSARRSRCSWSDRRRCGLNWDSRSCWVGRSDAFRAGFSDGANDRKFSVQSFLDKIRQEGEERQQQISLACRQRLTRANSGDAHGLQ